MEQQKIEFKKERDFSTVLGDSLLFLKQNFKSFFVSIVVIVGPAILLMSIAYAYTQTAMMSVISKPVSNPFEIFSLEYFIAIGVMVVCAFLANILLSGVVCNYLNLYNEKAIGEKITIAELVKRLTNNLGKIAASTLLLFLIVIVLFAVLILMGFGLAISVGAGTVIIFGFLIMVAMLFFVPIMAYFIPASFYVVTRDNVFIFSAMTKVKKYFSGNFWWTWLIMLVALIALGILQILFVLPASILSMMNLFSHIKDFESGGIESESNVLLLVLYTIGMFLTYCTYSIAYIVPAFNYMGHETQHQAKEVVNELNKNLS